MSDETSNEPPSCKRCGQQYVVECGYEPSKHGFCWPCCDEIVEKLFELRDDYCFIEDLATETYHAFVAHTKAKKADHRDVDVSFETRFIVTKLLERGTAPRE